MPDVHSAPVGASTLTGNFRKHLAFESRFLPSPHDLIVYLPPGRSALVSVGQTAIGGETVLADLKSDEAEREARRS